MNTVSELEVANTDQPRTKRGNSLALTIGGAFALLVIVGMIGGCLPEEPGAVAAQTPTEAAIPSPEADPNSRLAELEAEVARREAEAKLEARIEQLRAEAEQREEERQAAEAERIAEQERQATEAERELAESERAELRRQVGDRIKAAGAYIPPEPESVPELTEYTVVPGDFLAAIAGAHQITLGQLFDFNPSLNADSVIHPGDVILIPIGPIETAAAVTPVPASTPTARPQADVCASPSFESYANAMATHLASFATNSAFLSEQFRQVQINPTAFFVEDWRFTTILGLGLLRGDVTHIRRLQPPQIAEAAHEHALLAGDLIWDGADLIKQGIEDFSPELIERGSSLIIQAEPRLASYGVAIATLCG